MARPLRLVGRLTRQVRDLDGLVLRTRADVSDYGQALPVLKQMYQRWQRVAGLLLERGGAEVLTRQVELALLLDCRLDCRFAGEQQRR